MLDDRPASQALRSVGLCTRQLGLFENLAGALQCDPEASDALRAIVVQQCAVAPAQSHENGHLKVRVCNNKLPRRCCMLNTRIRSDKLLDSLSMAACTPLCVFERGCIAITKQCVSQRRALTCCAGDGTPPICIAHDTASSAAQHVIKEFAVVAFEAAAHLQHCRIAMASVGAAKGVGRGGAGAVCGTPKIGHHRFAELVIDSHGIRGSVERAHAFKESCCRGNLHSSCERRVGRVTCVEAPVNLCLEFAQ
mmetsp:Transcript_26953/g.83434  ORF Transcript_26953/g.83434 Transcript_26953/m.83434 type:complete len:251 (+) Transcript_26953:265-1017(+)